MRVIYHEVQMSSRSDVYDLRLIGDCHFGTVACEKDRLAKDFAEIGAIESGGWIGMGDYFEAVLPNDKRADGRVVDPDMMANAKQSYGKFANVCADQLADIMHPAAHNCIGLLEGNHEETINNRYHNDILDRLLGKLTEWNVSIENLTYEAVIILGFHRMVGSIKKGPGRNVKLYVWHGKGGGTTRAAQCNRLERMRTVVPDCEVYAVGHYHRVSHFPEYPFRIFESPENPKAIQREQWFIGSPSYYRAYVDGVSTYASRAGYAPSALGHARVLIRPFASTHVNGEDVEMPVIRPQW